MKVLRFILPLLLILGASAPVRSETDDLATKATCAEIVRTALEVVDEQCQQIGRNKVCYGHNLLKAQPHPQISPFEFEDEGDVADVVDIQNLQVSGMDLTAPSWGIALMQLQGELTGAAPEDLTLLLFGDVEIENQVVIGSTFDVTVMADSQVNVRNAPQTDADVVGKLQPGDVVSANGRITDGSWLRVSLPDGYGWVYAPLVSSTEDVSRLEVVQDEAAGFGPMRAIKLSTGIDDAMCAEAPNSGVLIQTPEGMAQVSLLINGVQVELGSTVYFQAEPGEAMIVRVVEGHATLTVGEDTTTIEAGFEASVPLDDTLSPTGPASEAVPYRMASVKSLPIELLPRSIDIFQNVEDTAADIEAEAETETETESETGEDVETTTGTETDAGTETGKPKDDDGKKTPAPKPTVPAEDTEVPPTTVPPTDVPPTAVPPTPVPPTAVPPTDVPPTDPPPPTEETMVICHKGNTITISVSAWPAHEAHGDTIGPCPEG